MTQEPTERGYEVLRRVNVFAKDLADLFCAGDFGRKDVKPKDLVEKQLALLRVALVLSRESFALSYEASPMIRIGNVKDEILSSSPVRKREPSVRSTQARVSDKGGKQRRVLMAKKKSSLSCNSEVKENMSATGGKANTSASSAAKLVPVWVQNMQAFGTNAEARKFNESRLDSLRISSTYSEPGFGRKGAAQGDDSDDSVSLRASSISSSFSSSLRGSS